MTAHHLSRGIIEPTRCHNSLMFISLLINSQHVSGIIMSIVRRIRLYLTPHVVVPDFAGCGRVEPGQSCSPDDGHNNARNMLRVN
jgi:hypothetical protein